MPTAPPHDIATARLRLRRPVPADADAMFERWAQDPDVTRYLVWRPHPDRSESVAHIERCATAWSTGESYVWFIEEKAGSRLVGSLAARDGAHGVNLGYLLARDAWGRGYMAEAVEPVVAWFLAQPHVFRVWATCDVENTASARVLEKAGFTFEGILRRWDHHPNIAAEPRDARCYSRVR